jgi:tRNA threonylcarbamoyl adenosine modification protein YeaZ/ribosomal-protein-alanine acetyltransferase
MLILALDTSMAACSVCIYDADRDAVLAQRMALMGRGQAEALAPMVQDAMQEAGVAYSSLNRVAVTIGPGTFTGVRIGLAFARGLGVSLGIPVAGFNSLAAIACNDRSASRPIIVASDARNHEIYLGVYGADGEERSPPAVFKLADAKNFLPEKPVTIIGTGADAVLEGTANHRHVRSQAGDFPNAANFARLATLMQPTGFPPEPLYLRPPDVKLPAQFSTVDATAAALLAEMHAACFGRPWDEASFSELLAGNGATAIVASTQSNPAGFVLFRRAADEAEILTICTLPALRQKGLAKSLVRQMEQLLKTQGVNSVFIEVSVSNEAALALYKSAGFKTAGQRKNYYQLENGVQEDAHIMRKGLQA